MEILVKDRKGSTKIAIASFCLSYFYIVAFFYYRSLSHNVRLADTALASVLYAFPLALVSLGYGFLVSPIHEFFEQFKIYTNCKLYLIFGFIFLPLLYEIVHILFTIAVPVMP